MEKKQIYQIPEIDSFTHTHTPSLALTLKRVRFLSRKITLFFYFEKKILSHSSMFFRPDY